MTEKKRYNTQKLREIQKIISRQITLKDTFKKNEIKTIAGFDVAIYEDKLVCACVILSYPDLKVIEKKYLVKPQPMPYVPTFMAFREGPLILELYYELECDPDILMIDGHGIAHPYMCGIASYVGHELSKPAIGVGKGMPQNATIYDEDKVVLRNQIRGFLVKTREYAKPLIVSPGHMISRETAAELVKACVKPPHKAPEPIHHAHRYAEKMKKALFTNRRPKKELPKEELSANAQGEKEFAAMSSFD